MEPENNANSNIQPQPKVLEKKLKFQPLRVIIIGLPCAGKRLVAQILQNKYDFELLKHQREVSQTAKIISQLCFSNYKDRKVYVLEKPTYQILFALKKRNFVNVILVEASPLKRYQYYSSLQKKTNNNVQDLQSFLKKDQQLYSQDFQKCLQFVRVRIFNRGDLNFLQRQIEMKKQQIIKPFRPTWSQYFMKIADIARRRSNCMKSSVGAVIVNKQNRVVSTGYNGTAKGLPSCFQQGCQRCNLNLNTSLDECLCLHAEQSAIIEVGIGRTNGCDLYTTLYPCFSCAKVIKQAGIARIFYLEQYDKKDSGKYFLENNFNKDTQIIQIKIDNKYY